MKRKLLLLALSLIVIFTIAFYQRSLDTNHINSEHSFLRQFLSYSQSSDRKLYPEFEEEYKIDNVENVPYFYFERVQRPSRKSKGCARFPNFFDLKFSNNYWQVQKTSKGTFYLFNAFLDKRENPVVRLIGLYDEYLPKQPFYCQFWYSTRPTPQITQSKILLWMFRQGWGADFKAWNQPYLITCPLPLNITELPVSVSLVESPCDFATNNMKIINKNSEKKKTFVVCVKGLQFFQEDISARLAEWIELLNILGKIK